MDNVDSEINEIKRKNFDLLKFPDNVPKGSSEDVIPHCFEKNCFHHSWPVYYPKKKIDLWIQFFFNF